MIYGLDKRIHEALGVRAYYPDDVEACVAKGAGIALDYVESDETDLFKRFYRKAYIHD